MSNKEDLKLVIHEADALLSDTSIFAILGINNPVDKIFDKIAGKGYYLTALGALTVLDLYSRVYFVLKSKPLKDLTHDQKKAITEIETLIKENKLKGYFIQKKVGSILSSDEDFFEKFMRDLKGKGLDVGLKDNEFRAAWKQIRNMLSHLTFPLGAIGGKHIESTNQGAITHLKLPLYDSVVVMETLRQSFLPSEAFKMDGDSLTVNSTVLLAYIYPIREFLLEEIDNSDEIVCKNALNSIKDLVNRQKVQLVGHILVLALLINL